MDRPRWPHQLFGHRAVLEAFDAGRRRVCLTSPTGMGKTQIVQDIIADFLAMEKRVALYSNRKMMIDQLSRAMDEAGFRHGIRSPDHDDERNLPFQISSIQTETKRAGKLEWQLHDLAGGGLAVIDEAHLNTGEGARRIIDAHEVTGGYVLGVTATPIDLGDTYQHLITAGTASTGRACGALVLAHHFAPDEPDWKEFNKLKKGRKIGEESDKISAAEARSAIMRPGIFGRVIDNYRLLNPEGRPTILFGPDVAGSLAFAEQFTLSGIEAVHIDGDDVWAKGRLYKSSQKVRESVLEASKDGRVKVICNRFVLREGVDAPWLSHGIFATVFGSLSSYLQSGGRLLRSNGLANSITIQDHGGHWWRFGSLNTDRKWLLGATNTSLLGMHGDKQRNSQRKPSPCPQCKEVQIWNGPTCQFCGWVAKPGAKVSRPVVQSNGELREMTGDVWKPRRISTRPDGPKRWKSMYFRSRQPKAKGRTFRAAMALFAKENYFAWPDPTWPYMPIAEIDRYRRVVDVPEDCLIQE
jgi:superfamily II DNA or RNA helicase